MKCYSMLQNAKVTAFTVSELLREKQQGGSDNPPPRFGLNLKNKQSFLEILMAGMNFTGISAIQSNGDHIVNFFHQFLHCI